jgi:hypothetical protein
MDCLEVQESILDSLVEPLVTERRLAMENHTASCRTCSGFAEIQRMLDARLAAAVSTASLSPGFRTSLKSKLCRDSVPAWPDFLPDLAHLAGCVFAIVLSLYLLPQYSGTLVRAGMALTAVTYFLQASLRSYFDEPGDA